MPLTARIYSMSFLSRRQFLKPSIASILIAAVLSTVSPFLAMSHDTEPFEFLVVGDSLNWGQGLDERDKYYSLTADWLRSEAFGRPREVNLMVKAHSGSTLKFHSDEAAKYKQAERDETFEYSPEVNVGFPSSWKQIETAAAEYKAAGKDGADLIMISGGITDITTERVLDPKGDDNELRSQIKTYCQDDMFDLLEHALATHPKALIAVIGYFPAITDSSNSGKLLNAWLETRGYPRAFKFLVNNPLSRSLFFEKLKKRAIVRSGIWYEESNRNMQIAVDRINEKYGRRRAVFIQSPLTDEHAAEAPNTMLFRMGKNGVVADYKAVERIRACRETLPKLKQTTGIAYPERLCEVAAVGHPTPDGSRAYAAAIRSVLGPLLVVGEGRR